MTSINHPNCMAQTIQALNQLKEERRLSSLYTHIADNCERSRDVQCGGVNCINCWNLCVRLLGFQELLGKYVHTVAMTRSPRNGRGLFPAITISESRPRSSGYGPRLRLTNLRVYTPS